jgi:hypothetical protein
MLAGDLLQRLPECIFKAYAGLRPAIETECLPTIDLVRRRFRRLIGITCRGGPWSPFLGAARAWPAKLECEGRPP